MQTATAELPSGGGKEGKCFSNSHTDICLRVRVHGKFKKQNTAQSPSFKEAEAQAPPVPGVSEGPSCLMAANHPSPCETIYWPLGLCMLLTGCHSILWATSCMT